MDESAVVTSTVVIAGKNTTSSTLVHPPTSSLLVFALINSAASLSCACLTAFCVVLGLGIVGYRRRLDQLVAERLAAAAAIFWSFEEDLERLVQLTEELRSRVILRRVTEFDLLAYKFRVENGVYRHGDTAPHQCFVTLKKLEHLVESVAIHLPRRSGRPRWQLRRIDGYGGLTFGSAVCRVVIATAPVWCDDSAPTVRRVVHYLAGEPATVEFDAVRQSDSVIEHRVLATVPYVRSLHLIGDRFLLSDPLAVPDVDLRRKIAEVDAVLSVNGGRSVALRCPAAAVSGYTAVRELCVDAGLVRRGDTELPERLAAADKAVPLLRHILRLSCGTTTAVRRTGTDERFVPLMTRLHSDLVGSVDAPTVQAAERRRDSTLAIAAALAPPLTRLDPDFTKAVLEKVERQLYRHVQHLSTQQTLSAVPTTFDPADTEPVAGPSGLQLSPRAMVSAEEESSGPSGQYVAAVSLLSLEPSVSSVLKSTAGDNSDDQYLETAI